MSALAETALKSQDDYAVEREYAAAKEAARGVGHESSGLVDLAKKLAEADDQLATADTNRRKAEAQMLEARKYEARLRAHRDVWAERLKREIR